MQIDASTMWLATGIVGQALFMMRFVVQWLASERHGRSVMPVAFWYFGVAGAAALLIYAVHLHDPVFILGQSAGLALYLRNLHWLRRQRLRAAG
jgi:lipid-A-disaccharide synthase-like uncharacterized protein